MKFLRAPASQGVAWVREGFRAFRRQPFALVMLFALYLLALRVLTLVPLVGTGLAFALTPLATLAFMLVGQRAALGERPLPSAMSSIAGAGRERLRELAKLCALYGVAVVAIVLVVGAIDNGATAAWVKAMQALVASPPPPGELIDVPVPDARSPFALLALAVLGTALSAAFWQAPGLVYWGRQGWAKSLFFSTIAVWRNKAAFSLYGLAWLGVWIVIAFAVNLASLLTGSAPSPEPNPVLLFPAICVYGTLTYCSLWASFAGCFDVGLLADDAPRA